MKPIILPRKLMLLIVHFVLGILMVSSQPVLVSLSVAMVKTLTKINLWRKGFISTYRLQSVVEEDEQELKAGRKAETMWESCLLVFSS